MEYPILTRNDTCIMLQTGGGKYDTKIIKSNRSNFLLHSRLFVTEQCSLCNDVISIVKYIPCTIIYYIYFSESKNKSNVPFQLKI